MLEFFGVQTLSFHKCVTACVGSVLTNLVDFGEFSNACCKSDMYMYNYVIEFVASSCCCTSCMQTVNFSLTSFSTSNS